MCWLTEDHLAEVKRNALALTPEQRTSLTWDEAQRFVPADTLCMAVFQGIQRRKEITPWQAVCHINHIEDNGI